MKSLGIVGGIAPESTIDYYRRLIAAYRAEVPDGSYPPLFITSIDVTQVLRLVGEGRLEELTAYLLSAVQQLARAGADVGLLAANTPHLVFDDLAARSPIPLISLVEAVGDEARRRGLSRVSLFGTCFTVEGAFYPTVLNRHGVTVIRPNPTEVAAIHEAYVNELVAGTFRQETRDALGRIAARLRDEEGVDAVVLAGTELSLLMRDAQHQPVLLLDSTEIHVGKALQVMLGQSTG